MIRLIIKYGFYLFLLACAVIVIINYQFFWSQISYIFAKPEVIQNQKDRAEIDPTVVVEPFQLVIPKIGLTAPIAQSEGDTEADFQEALQNGVVQYPGSADPGQFGNMYLFGHSSDYPWSEGSYKTVFALLPQLAIGDEISVSNGQGNVYTYEVSEKFVVQPDDISVLTQEGFDRPTLTLQTSYPIGTALRRYIVRAQLIDQ